jgi:hypothetical protein
MEACAALTTLAAMGPDLCGLVLQRGGLLQLHRILERCNEHAGTQPHAAYIAASACRALKLLYDSEAPTPPTCTQGRRLLCACLERFASDPLLPLAALLALNPLVAARDAGMGVGVGGSGGADCFLAVFTALEANPVDVMLWDEGKVLLQ